MRFLLFGPYMRCHEMETFGSLCEFLVNFICVLLDNFLVRCHAFLTVMRFRDEISCFLLHILFSNVRVSKVTTMG